MLFRPYSSDQTLKCRPHARSVSLHNQPKNEKKKKKIWILLTSYKMQNSGLKSPLTSPPRDRTDAYTHVTLAPGYVQERNDNATV